MNARTLRSAGLTATAALLMAACAKHSSGQSQPPGAPPAPAAEGSSAPAPVPPILASNPTNQLVAPIALYPDPLIALILPAAVNSTQVSEAAQYLSNGGDPNGAQGQPWDDSVRSLSHYPQVVEWMAQNMTWTQQLGAAFASDPSAVMSAVQALRAAAQSSGALASTPQQTVDDDDGAIEIEPASDSEIYAPSYDPNLVYADSLYGYDGPFLAFNDPWPTGAWLDFGFDWGNRSIWYGDARYWHNGGHWVSYGHGAPPAAFHAWHPSGPAPRAAVYSAPAAPAPMRGAPPPPHRTYAGPAARSEPSVREQPDLRSVAHPTPAPDMRDVDPRAERPEARPVENRPPEPGIERREAPPHAAPAPRHDDHPESRSAPDRDRDHDH